MARKWPVFVRRVKSLLKYALLGASLTLSIAFGPSLANLTPFLTSQPLLGAEGAPVLAQTPVTDGAQLLEQGRQFYEKGQSTEASTVWQQAAAVFAVQRDTLNQARVMSFLSLAYQQLGQWDEADKAIAHSLNLLQKENIGNPKDRLPILAQALTTQGHLQLALGKAQAALTIWQQATDLYARLGNETGVIGSFVNQSLAMQALGLYRRACDTLAQALELDKQVCEPSTQREQTLPEQLDSLTGAIQKQPDSPIRATGLRSLGEILRVVGNLDKSQEVLQQSLKMAKRLQSDADISMAVLSLGNTERALYNRAKDLYDRTESSNDRKKAKQKAIQALDFYQQAATISTSKTTWIQAQLNRLSFLLEFKQWLLEEKQKPDVEALERQIQSQIADLPQIQSLFAKEPPNQTTIYARLNFAQSLLRLKEKDEFLRIALQQAQEAAQSAKNLKDQRAEAFALGTLGHLYEQTQEWSRAQEFTEQALGLAQAIYAWDIAYQWQWQLGRIYQGLGETENAIAFYDVAIKTLEPIRKDLLAINSDVQFSFQKDVAPVYREPIDLLLQSDPDPKKLEKALEINGLLQSAELENFLQCGLLNLVSLDKVENLPESVIYTIVVDNRVEVIVQSQKRILYHYKVSASLEEVEDTVRELRSALENNKSPSEWVLQPAQKLYNWLLAPGKAILPEKGTLVFALDSELQKIPMAVLHDGNQFLVQKYSIALTLGSRVPAPKSLLPKQLRALIAGLSEESPSFGTSRFESLPNVVFELEEVEKNTINSEKLTNKKFTKEKFQSEVNASDFPVIHLATHGRFSSDPEQTFILAYDVPINIKQLDRLLRRRTQGTLNTIELLVLSACQTAEGDKRAALGIAGVAVQAGAHSTLASLWEVNDRSTADLMSLFYQALKAGETKAEALQHAQQALLQKYDHPYYWAAFVLAGNWL
jgi:CHAT domain-containing protein